MGYYYLPATHPAIKTSGATSPQRRAAALPPFLSLPRAQCAQSHWLQTPHVSRQSVGALLHFPPLDILLKVHFFPPLYFLLIFWMGSSAQNEELFEWTFLTAGRCDSVWKRDAERSSEEQLCLLVVWKYKDTWGEPWKLKEGGWCLLITVECQRAYQDLCKFVRKRLLQHA